MAMNLKGKKTSLEEKASIYRKRQDDMPERERIRQMSGKQKWEHFKAYYLPVVLIILAVAAIAFYIIWVDFINKSHIYLHCAILNESISDDVLTELSDNFTESVGMDSGKNKTSFYLYYTQPDAAMKMGADAGRDLSEISSRLIASSLDCMIASEEDVKDSYMKKGFFADLDKILTKEELTRLEPYLYRTSGKDAKPCGIYLKQSAVYQSLFSDRTPMVENPVFFIITNGSEEGKKSARQLINYLFADPVSLATTTKRPSSV